MILQGDEVLEGDGGESQNSRVSSTSDDKTHPAAAAHDEYGHGCLFEGSPDLCITGSPTL